MCWCIRLNSNAPAKWLVLQVNCRSYRPTVTTWYIITVSFSASNLIAHIITYSTNFVHPNMIYQRLYTISMLGNATISGLFLTMWNVCKGVEIMYIWRNRRYSVQEYASILLLPDYTNWNAFFHCKKWFLPPCSALLYQMLIPNTSRTTSIYLWYKIYHLFETLNTSHTIVTCCHFDYYTRDWSLTPMLSNVLGTPFLLNYPTLHARYNSWWGW